MSHPPWSGDRLPLSEARHQGGPVAGRFLHGSRRDRLEDASASVEILSASPRPGHGDQVAGWLDASPEGSRLRDVRVLAPCRRTPSPELLRAAAQAPALRQRAAVLAVLREGLAARGFLEVETPARVANPGLEPHLRPFMAPGADGRETYLITSPELHLKRLLAAGYERVFEFARCFRDEERGRMHLPEFLMLEWYRSHAGLDDLAADLASLLALCAAALALPASRTPAGCDLSAPPDVLPYLDTFERLAGRPAEGMDAGEREQAFSSLVEPRLGRERPALVVDWPEEDAALARLRVDSRGRRVAARMELYVDGIELANGFDELTDPDEQRRRHEADRAARIAAGTHVPPLDEGFLAALETGIPPSAGMALGVDRLVMVLLGAASVGDVRLFEDR